MPRSRSTGKATAKQQKAEARKKSARTSPSARQRSARLLGKAILSPIPDAPEISFDANAITTYRELLAALGAHRAQITLANNIIAEDNILINHDVAINFNGYSIISNETHAAARVIDVRSGEVTLLGQGKIFAMGKNSVAIRAFGAISNGVPNYTTVTVDEGISLFAPDSYGILISPNLGVAYGLTLNIAGQIFAHDGICLASGIRGYDTNAPVINIKNGAEIMADEASGVAIEAAGYGKWNVITAKLHGAVGAAMASGILNFNQAQILSSTGECFRIMENPDTMLEVNIDGGNYVATTQSVIAGASKSLKKFSAKNCDFYSVVDAIPADFTGAVKLKKVDLNSDVAGYLSGLANLSAPAPNPAAPTETNEPISKESAEPIATTKDQPVSTATPPSPKSTKLSSPAKTKPAELDSEEDAIEAALQREIDALDAEEFGELELSPEESASEAFALEAYSPAESKPTKSKRKTRTLKPKRQNKKSSPLANLAGLSDEATDEKEILLELTAEKVERPREMPVLAPAPEPILPFTSEQDAARRALTDAIMDIRKLSSEDYDTGFSELEQAIQQAEQLLTNPFASLSDICDAASALLNAFDDLEERDDAASMSDAELDELFYHGAVLQEMLKESPKEKPKSHKKSHKIKTLLPESTVSASIGIAGLFQEIERRQLDSPQPQVAPTVDNPNLAPNYSNLVAVLTRIAELDLNSYTLASQENLLSSLSYAQEVLNNPNAAQHVINHLANQLSEEIVQLVPLRRPYNSTSKSYIEPSAPAPVISATIASAMIDEMAPPATWSLGVTMIDEMTPFTIDATTREKMLRAMQSRFYLIKKSLSRPFVKLSKSFVAGFRAGIRAYKETLHAFSD